MRGRAELLLFKSVDLVEGFYFITASLDSSS